LWPKCKVESRAFSKPGFGPNGAHIFLDAEEAISRMTVAKRMKVSLFASEEQFPYLAKPVQMIFDTKVSLWVSAWPTYSQRKPREEMDEKILILQDTHAQGQTPFDPLAEGFGRPSLAQFANGAATDLFLVKLSLLLM